MKLSTKILTALGISVGLFGSQAIMAQEYPKYPIRMIVPYPPGGATDVIGRVVAKELADELKASVVVENRGGASGSIGASEVARAKPDGYTILLGALTSHSIYQQLYKDNVTYNLTEDFEPVAIVGKVPLVVIVNPKVEAKTLGEFINLAKEKPGRYTMASAGMGSPQHMAGELLALTTDTEFVSVPYRGSGPAVVDLIGGQVDSIIETVPAAQAHIKSGAVRALAVASDERTPTLPDVQSAKEAGIDNFNVESMFGLMAPAGTPQAVIDTLASAVERALAKPATQEALAQQGVVTQYYAPEAASKEIKSELEKWKEVIEKAGITPE